MPAKRSYVLCAMLSLIGPTITALGAQADVRVPSPTQCDSLASAGSRDPEGASRPLTFCGQRGVAALVTILKDSRGFETARKIKIVDNVARLVDPLTHEALITFAEDASQPAEVRVRALQGAVLSGGGPRYVPGRGPADRPCTMQDVPHYRSVVGRTDREVLTRSFDRFRRMRDDATLALPVRQVATCATAFFRGALGIPYDFDASKISLTYVCGNTFEVRNGNAEGWVDLRYEVSAPEGTPVPLRLSAGRVQRIHPSERGAVRLFAKDQLVAEVANAGAQCR